MGYKFLTHVQKDTLPLALEGRDVLAKGKTGNGKTIAFLLPTLERMIKNPRPKRGQISALVISPTRELAQQIAVEAVKLTSAHSLRTACFVGGSSVNKDVKELMNAGGIDVLVSTPGRLQAHLEEDSAHIRQKLDNLQVLVLDEADRLLDMGFRPDIMRIISHLPKERQTLLFSATLPTATDELKKVALRDDFTFVNTIEGDDQQTNTQTVQEYVVCDLQGVIPMVERILDEHMKLPAYKVIVFLPTARAAQFMAHLFQAAEFPNVLEMHSRKSQSARTKAADAFRKGKKVVMFSSDVSARGVDYPDVSLVLQAGLTDRDQYIHRLGRTARAGMEGRGILVLADFEKSMLRELADLPLSELGQDAQLDQQTTRTASALANVHPRSELGKSAEKAYAAFLGFYNSNLKKLRMSKTDLVETGARYSQIIGLEEVPKLQKRTLRAMGLLDTPGLVAASKAAGAGTFKPKGAGGGLQKASREKHGSEEKGSYRSLLTRKKQNSHEDDGRSRKACSRDATRGEQGRRNSRSTSPGSRDGLIHRRKSSSSLTAKRDYKESYQR
uniref:ATP-dependent RNA helicase n=1 Tax=Hyaloperonospora arabidopsidis (strain Emoy2) TaxID=559515 RepID=M4C0I4_HYAAE